MAKVKNTSVVLGTFFGDEGKGLMTSHLCNNNGNNLVIRPNAGHQSGHTVVKDEYRHVFSNFGAGTLAGAHTFWSEYCTFYPKSFCNERKRLVEKGFEPTHFIHPLSMVTTPFDINYNRDTESNLRHGSVGVGFGATIERNVNTPYKLYACDLKFRDLLVQKLRNISYYYGNKPSFGIYKNSHIESVIEEFLSYVDNIDLNILTLDSIKDNYDQIVFEGSQGIMLDMDLGFFPNVTRSNTTSKNAFEIVKKYSLPEPDVYYCMRSYLTRHGNGFMPNESSELNFEDKTNVKHEWQGNFRQGYHSEEMFQYAMLADSSFSGYNSEKKHLFITCLDQTEGNILIDNEKIKLGNFIDSIASKFIDGDIYVNTSPNVETIEKWHTTYQW